MRRSLRLALLACVALVAGLVPAAAQAQTDGLRLATVKHSRLGTHDWYQQTRDGVPVLGGYLARHYDTAGRLVRVDDGRLAASGLASLSPSVSADSAKAGTSRHGAGTPRAATLAVRPGSPARLVWVVLASTSRGTTRTLVDAGTGAVVESRSMGRDQANNVILEAHFDFNPRITFAAAARRTVDAARRLVGPVGASKVRAAFQARGIL